MRKTLLLTIFFSILALQSSAQKFEWEIDAQIFVDNAEVNSDVVVSQTLAGVWIAPRVGVSFLDSTRNSTHRLMVGVDFTQQFGYPAFGEVLRAQIFYNYQGGKGADHYFGLMPRSALRGDYSRAMFSDSLGYFNHTIQGAVMSWRGKHLSGEVFLDWFSLNHADRSEAFMVGGNFAANFARLFTADLSVSYIHNKINSDQSFLRDLATYNLMVGVDLTPITPLEVLSVELGVLGSLDRDRLSFENAGAWQPAIGFNGRVRARYKGFGLEDEVFAGSGLGVFWGSEYYTEPFYNRAEASWSYLLDIKKICKVDFKVALVLNTTQDGSDFSQMASISLNF